MVRLRVFMTVRFLLSGITFTVFSRYILTKTDVLLQRSQKQSSLDAHYAFKNFQQSMSRFFEESQARLSTSKIARNKTDLGKTNAPLEGKYNMIITSPIVRNISLLLDVDAEHVLKEDGKNGNKYQSTKLWYANSDYNIFKLRTGPSGVETKNSMMIVEDDLQANVAKLSMSFSTTTKVSHNNLTTEPIHVQRDSSMSPDEYTLNTNVTQTYTLNSSIIHIVNHKNESAMKPSFIRWPWKMDIATIAHLKYWWKEHKKFVGFSGFTGSEKKNCLESQRAIFIPHMVMPNICTNSNSQPDLVTLILPMTDVEQFWENLVKHGKRWNGPIAVGFMFNTSVYYEQHPGLEAELVQLLNHRIQKFILSANISSQICFHLVIPKKSYPPDFFPIQTLRNMALHYSRTSLILLLEADFITSQNMSENLAKAILQTGQPVEKNAFVLPLFHIYTIKKNVTHIPADKSKLLAMWKKKQLISMGQMRGDGHKATNDKRFKSSNIQYPIEYRQYYEPYYVLNRSMVPYYPEQLLYGHLDKAVYTHMLHLLGFKFVALNPFFLLHPDHKLNLVKRTKPMRKCLQVVHDSFIENFSKTVTGKGIPKIRQGAHHKIIYRRGTVLNQSKQGGQQHKTAAKQPNQPKQNGQQRNRVVQPRDRKPHKLQSNYAQLIRMRAINRQAALEKMKKLEKLGRDKSKGLILKQR